MTRTQSSPGQAGNTENSHFSTCVGRAVQVLQSLLHLEENLVRAARACSHSLRQGGKLLTCGNGGSACDAQHLTGELMGRYKTNRVPLPSVALNADSVLLTCIGNDFSFKDAFARQLEALAGPHDVLVAFSTSGNSPNVLQALAAAREKKITSIAFLGGNGGDAKSLANHALVVSDSDTARIQEAHQFLLHTLMDCIERDLGHI